MDSTVVADDTKAECRGRGYVTTCPHCGREVPGNMIDMHTSVCIYRPEMQERIRAALTSDVPQEYTHVRNKVQFTGATRFNIDKSTNLSEDEKKHFAELATKMGWRY